MDTKREGAACPLGQVQHRLVVYFWIDVFSSSHVLDMTRLDRMVLQVSSLASGEDDNDGGGGDVEADDALAAKGEDLGMEGEGEAGGDEEVGDEDGPGGAGVGRGGGGVGPTASATFQHGFSGGRVGRSGDREGGSAMWAPKLRR